MSDFVVQRRGMFSGQAACEARTYRKFTDPYDRTWYWSTGENAGDHIYLADPKCRQGFGGSNIHFKLDDDSIDVIKGPWHSNSTSFFKATGIDLRDRHLTFCVVAKERVSDGWDTILKDIIYQDDTPTIGSASRGRDMAQQIANDLGIIVFFFDQGTSGSSCGPVYPERKEECGKA